MGQFRVLVVGESAALRQHIKYVLSQQRFIMSEAAEVVTGIEKLREDFYSLILVDDMFPPLPMVHFLQSIRKLHGYSAVPILLLRDETQSLWNDNEFGLTGFPRGRFLDDDLDFYYLTKPISTLALNSMVNRILKENFSAEHRYLQPT